MATRGSRPEVITIGGGNGITLRPRLVLAGIIALMLVLWFVRGGPAYTVAPDEEGVVLTFGRYTKTTQPGFHFKLPWPIQTVLTPKVAEVKRLEFGFRTQRIGRTVTSTSFRDNTALLAEAQMLTGDENVVDCAMTVQYRIRDSREYLFNFDVGDVERTLRDIGEAALRQAVGDHPIDDVLTTGKFEVQNEIKEKMQELADLYRAGVSITEVQLQDVQPPREVATAFRDVATAREEREKIINEALAYQREQIPKSEGEGERLRQEAMGYKEARIAKAHGAVTRFKAIAKEFEAAPEVTRARLYLETMTDLLPQIRVTIVDEDIGIVNLKALGGALTSPVTTQRGEGR